MSLRGRTAWQLAVLAASFLVLPAFAQAPVVPPGAEPGRVEQQLQRLPEPAPPPDRRRVAPPRLTEQAPADAKEIRIAVSRVDLAGPAYFFRNELLPKIDSLNGSEVSLAKVYGLAGELTDHFRNAGYILTSVRVPPQTITNGVVRLEILEGYLSDVILQGARVRAGLFADARRALLAERPLRSESLERFLLLFNDLPGVAARGFLRASPDQPGASELIVQVGQPRANLQLGGSNRGSNYQGPNQYRLTASLNSVLGLSESTTFQYLQAQRANELQLFSVSNTTRLTASGLDLDLSASVSSGAPDLGAALGGFPLETDSRQLRAELGIPLVRTRTSNLRTRLALTWHDGESTIGGERFSADTLSAVRLGATWDWSDPRAGVNVLDVELGKGIGAFGASQPGAGDASRPGGDPRFWKATLYAARLQSLSHGFSALLAVSGQYAFENLLSPEEFAFGGEQFGRAYDPSELVGDSGWAGKLELRHTGQLGASLGYTLYAFGERGAVHRRFDASEGDGDSSESATSMGGGLRLTWRGWLTGYVEGVKPTDRPLSAYGTKKARAFGGVQLTYGF